MGQKCSECGRESPLGQPFQHYWGCVHDKAGVKPMLSKTIPDKWPMQPTKGEEG